MNKTELVVWHEFLVELHEYTDIELPEEYNKLTIAPEHVHKNKSKHKEAVEILAENSSEKLG